jgi:hypothetical protein
VVVADSSQLVLVGWGPGGIGMCRRGGVAFNLQQNPRSLPTLPPLQVPRITAHPLEMLHIAALSPELPNSAVLHRPIANMTDDKLLSHPKA